MGDKQQYPIGIFDSGLGGITVLKALYRQLPQESIVYFADTARLPYGNRTQAEIIQFVREILSWMETQGVKMVVMACNTSSALALDIIRSEFDIPVLGLILPGAKGAVSQGRRIGVISTPATAASHAYRNAILEVDSDTQVWEVPCPEFVPLIEANRLFDPYTRRVAQTYLQSLIANDIDTLIYGCTHYRHLEQTLKTLLPENVVCIDPAEHVVGAAEQELELMGWKNTGSPLPTRFAVSGCPDQFAQLSRQWLGYTPDVEKVNLPKVSPVHSISLVSE